MEEPLTTDKLRALDLDGPISEPLSLDLYAATSELTDAGRKADEEGQLEQAYVYRLLSAICNLHFRPDERAEPYGPKATFANGLRTAVGNSADQEYV